MRMEGPAGRADGAPPPTGARRPAAQEQSSSGTVADIALEVLSEGVIVHGPGGRVLSANPAALRILGLRGDLTGTTPGWRLFREDGRMWDLADAPVPVTMHTGEPQTDVVMGIERPDHSIAWVSVSSRAATLPDGSRCVVTAFVDMTAARDAQRRLRERELQFRMIADSALVVQARAGIAEWVAPSVEGLLGWTPEDMFDRDLREIVHPEDLDVIEAPTADTDLGGEARLRLRVRHKAGRYVWVEATARALRDETGAFTGSSVYTLWGVDAEVAAVEALARTEAQRRDLELRMQQSERIESLGVLAGGVAHDFNNILAAILGNVSFARDEVGPGHPALKSLEQVHSAGLRGKALVDQILAFSRNRPTALVAQPLRPLVEEALAQVRVAVPSSVVIESVLAEEPIIVSTDGTKIGQTLINLCTNAWHAAGGDQARVTVGLEQCTLAASDAEVLEVAPGPCAHLWVADQGVGIDASALPHIFDPFFTTKSVGLGTGLGLSVVHGIVRDHGGRISVDTAPGEGTTFHLYFPLASSATPDEAEPQETKPTPRRSARVLYVDDDELVLGLVRRVMQRAGMDITCLSDPVDAVAAVRSAPRAFDIVVTDFNMPVLTGIDLASAVIDIRSDLPVVISSGYVTSDMIAAAQTVGVRHVLHKENTINELVGVVEEVLASTRGA